MNHSSASSAQMKRSTPQFQETGRTPSFREGNQGAQMIEEPRTPPPAQLYPNSHSHRCLRLSLSPSRIKPLTLAQAEKTVESLHAWEARKTLRIQQLKTELETAEMESATFRPILAPHTVKILIEKDVRDGLLTERHETELLVKESVRTAIMNLPPDAKTHFSAYTFVSSSLPGSRSHSPETDGPNKVAKRNEIWLKERNEKVKRRTKALPLGATFQPRVNGTGKRRDGQGAVTGRGVLVASSSYNQSLSTKATLKQEKTKSDLFSQRQLSPVSRTVSYKAGLDLTSFLKRAKPLIQMKDLGL